VNTSALLVVIYSAQLEIVQEEIVQNGGRITKQPFDFPGGRRFHFKDPAGNQLAVWSDR
jgi:predicted enzyme related to lactoylglutathione lyase